MRKQAFIYIIGVTANPVKIGHAIDVPKRLSMLQVGCPDELALHYTFKVPADLAPQVEAHVHATLQAQRRRGEWFNVDAAEAYDVVLREGTRRIAFAETLQGAWRTEIMGLPGLKWGPFTSADAIATYLIETDGEAQARLVVDEGDRDLLESWARGASCVGRPPEERARLARIVDELTDALRSPQRVAA